MLDIAVAYNRYIFVGQEFLTWLWFLSETDPDSLSSIHPELTDFRIGNRIVLENRYGDDRIETLTIKGDTAGLEEGKLALTKGAIVTEMQVVLLSGENEWKFVIKGENTGLFNLKTPDTAAVKDEEEMEGAIIEKIFLLKKCHEIMDTVFIFFIKKRISEDWKTTLHSIRKWIK